jgi:hypothetical protein
MASHLSRDQVSSIIAHGRNDRNPFALLPDPGLLIYDH